MYVDYLEETNKQEQPVGGVHNTLIVSFEEGLNTSPSKKVGILDRGLYLIMWV